MRVRGLFERWSLTPRRPLEPVHRAKLRRWQRHAFAQAYRPSFMTFTLAFALVSMPAVTWLGRYLYGETAWGQQLAEDRDARQRARLLGFGLENAEASLPGAVTLRHSLGVELLRAKASVTLPLLERSVTATAPSHEQAEHTARILTAELRRYPRPFLERSALKRVILVAGLTDGGVPIPSLPNYDRSLLLDVDLAEAFLRRLIHHEVFHFADFADDQLVKVDAAWERLNPRGFAYGRGGRAMRAPNSGEWTDERPGFLTLYSTSAVEEDKAELFAYLMVEPARVARRAARDHILARKVEAIVTQLEALDPSMNALFWRRNGLPESVL